MRSPVTGCGHFAFGLERVWCQHRAPPAVFPAMGVRAFSIRAGRARWHGIRRLVAMTRRKRHVSSTGVTLTGDLPDTRAMVDFLAPYARGAWHWFGLQATLAVLSIVVGLAVPALAAVAIDQAVAGRIGWGFFGLAGAMAASALLGTATGPVASRFGVALGGRLTRRVVAHALDIGLPGRRPFDDGDLLNRAASLAPGMPGYASTLLRVATGLAMAVGSLAALLFIHWLFVGSGRSASAVSHCSLGASWRCFRPSRRATTNWLDAS